MTPMLKIGNQDKAVTAHALTKVTPLSTDASLSLRNSQSSYGTQPVSKADMAAIAPLLVPRKTVQAPRLHPSSPPPCRSLPNHCIPWECLTSRMSHSPDAPKHPLGISICISCPSWFCIHSGQALPFSGNEIEYNLEIGMATPPSLNGHLRVRICGRYLISGLPLPVCIPEPHASLSSFLGWGYWCPAHRLRMK